MTCNTGALFDMIGRSWLSLLSCSSSSLLCLGLCPIFCTLYIRSQFSSFSWCPFNLRYIWWVWGATAIFAVMAFSVFPVLRCIPRGRFLQAIVNRSSGHCAYGITLGLSFRLSGGVFRRGPWRLVLLRVLFFWKRLEHGAVTVST